MAPATARAETQGDAGPDDAAARAAEIDREFEAALTTLAREVAGLRRALQNLIDQMGCVGEAGAEAARAATRAATTGGLGASERVTAELGGELSGVRDDLVRTARDHPWRTLGLAAAAGLVLGLAMRR